MNNYDGKTEVVKPAASGSNYTYNTWGLDNIGQIKIVNSVDTKYFYLKDHLGKIKMTLNTSSSILGYDDYYPFGSIMPGRSQDDASVDGRYKFTGKERDAAETGWDYFGARYYDSFIGRWLQVDPLDSKYPWVSPYNYALNNPLRFTDPSGQYASEAQRAQEEERKKQEEKRILEQTSTSESKAQVIPIPGPTPMPYPITPPNINSVEQTGKAIVALHKKLKELNGTVEGIKFIIGAAIVTGISNLFAEKTVGDVLKGKKGSIKNAPLPPGSPSWEDIKDTPISKIEEGASKNLPGYKTIKKLLGQKRFNK